MAEDYAYYEFNHPLSFPQKYIRTMSKNNVTNRPFAAVKARPILTSCTVCLTGFPPDKKLKLVSLIKSLGGRHTSVLILSGPDRPTHLIAEIDPMDGSALSSEKVVAAAEHNLYWERRKLDERIHVVSEDWLRECLAQRRHVSEEQYMLCLNLDEGEASSVKDKSAPMMCRGVDISGLPLEKACDVLLDDTDDQREDDRYILAPYQFYLIGFDSMTSSGGKMKRRKIRNHSVGTIREKIAALIRRKFGTTCWDLHERITHVIVREDCEEHLWDGARSLKSYHPNSPEVVTPHWLLATFCNAAIPPIGMYEAKKRHIHISSSTAPLNKTALTSKDLDFPNKEKDLIQTTSVGDVSKMVKEAKTNDSLRKKNIPKHKSKVNFQPNKPFHGSWFLIKHNGNSELSRLIVYLGGKIYKESDAPMTQIGTCFVVTMTKMEFIEEISLVFENIEFVSPVYILAVAKAIKYKDTASLPIDPKSYPDLFRPLLAPVPRSRRSSSSPIIVSITGFSGPERYGMEYFISEVLAFKYTESLRKGENTHLVSKSACGKKYLHAVHWGAKVIEVVNVEWLWHVAKSGYEDNCEFKFRFPVVTPTEKYTVEKLPQTSSNENANTVQTESKESNARCQVTPGLETIKQCRIKTENKTPSLPEVGENAHNSPKVNTPLLQLSENQKESDVSRSQTINHMLRDLKGKENGQSCIEEQGEFQNDKILIRTRPRRGRSRRLAEAFSTHAEEKYTTHKRLEGDMIELKSAGHRKKGERCESQAVWFAEPSQEQNELQYTEDQEECYYTRS